MRRAHQDGFGAALTGPIVVQQDPTEESVAFVNVTDKSGETWATYVQEYDLTHPMRVYIVTNQGFFYFWDPVAVEIISKEHQPEEWAKITEE